MRDVKRWGVLTIGTGLGNARFTNRASRRQGLTNPLPAAHMPKKPLGGNRLKPAPFAYAKARSVAHAIELLANDEARLLAGGQSLIATLNMRLISACLACVVGRSRRSVAEHRLDVERVFARDAQREAVEEGGHEPPDLLPLDVGAEPSRLPARSRTSLEAGAGVRGLGLEPSDEILVVAHSALGLDQDGEPLRVLVGQSAGTRRGLTRTGCRRSGCSSPSLAREKFVLVLEVVEDRASGEACRLLEPCDGGALVPVFGKRARARRRGSRRGGRPDAPESPLACGRILAI